MKNIFPYGKTDCLIICYRVKIVKPRTPCANQINSSKILLKAKPGKGIKSPISNMTKKNLNAIMNRMKNYEVNFPIPRNYIFLVLVR